MTEKHKICFKCGESKPLSAFYKHPKMQDGHVNKCKECNKVDVRLNRKENIDFYREYDHKRSKENTQRLLQQKEYAVGYRALNTHKKKAQSALRSAVKSGRIKIPDNCEHCGIEHSKLNGHHSSYSDDMQLLVTWLCPSCHATLHRHFEHGIDTV